MVVVVDFYADWCVSCKALAPELEALSQEWAGKGIRFVQLDVDKARRWQRSIGSRRSPPSSCSIMPLTGNAPTKHRSPRLGLSAGVLTP